MPIVALTRKSSWMILGSCSRRSDAPFLAGYHKKLIRYGIAMGITRSEY